MSVVKTALLVCGGEPPSPFLLEQYQVQSCLTVGVDRGARFLLSQGIRPDFILGDGDSLGDSREAGVPWICTPDQNENDLTKALRWLELEGFRRVFILGAQGRRTDHLLGNLGSLLLFYGRLEALLIDAYSRVWFAPLHQTLDRSAGRWVSFFAWGEDSVQGLTLRGVAYPLTNATLRVSSPRASLNEIVEDPAFCSYQSGCLLVIQSGDDSEG